jgi:hypothetical protein
LIPRHNGATDRKGNRRNPQVLCASSNFLLEQRLKLTHSSSIEVEDSLRSVEIERLVELAIAKSQLLKVTGRPADDFEPSSDLFLVADDRHSQVRAGRRLNFPSDDRIAPLKERNVVGIQNPKHGLNVVTVMKFWPIGIQFAPINRNFL